MEDITLERLLNDFRGVIDQMNDIVERQDIEQAREALKQIQELVNNEQGIPLDEGVEEDYDHVLHQLLSQISGVIEVSRENPVEPNPEEQQEDQDDIEVLFEGDIASGMPSPEEQFERATGIKFDPEIHEIYYMGADGQDATDEPITPFQVYRKREQSRDNRSNGPEKHNLQEIIERLERERAELQTEYMSATGGANNRGATQKSQDLYVKLSEKTAQIRALKNILEDIGTNEEQNLQELLERLESERAQLEEEYNRAMEESNGGATQKNQDLYVALGRKTAEVNALKSVIEDLERDEGHNAPGGRNVTDRLDIAEEAAKIGDHIFKAAAIRKELQDRDVSREDFLQFYETGIEHSRSQQEYINTQIEELEDEVGSITNSDSGVNLYEQLNNAAQIENEEERNAERIRILEEIRKNFIKNGQYDEELERYGFLETEITSAEQADRFDTDFFQKFINNANKMLVNLRTQYEDQRENIDIYQTEIGRIKEEQKSIEVAEGNLESLEEDNEEEKALRERQIRATIFGDPELEQEWNERVKRFVSHRVESRRILEVENGRYDIEFDTIEDYPEYEEDAHFLNLDDYKKYLELTTLYENSGHDLNFILRVLDPEERAEYERREQETSGAGKQWLDEYMADKAEYVRSFHGFTNEHGVKYSTYKTAGSMLKAMKPVKGDLPATTKVGNAIENTFRFFGLRRPEFSRLDEHGNKVSNVGGGLLTLATDALVVGGMTAAALAGPIGWATAGSAYAVRGGVLAGNRIAARRYYKKHKDEIDANLPTLGHPSKDDKEVARKDYYRRVEGKGRLRSWLKAKNDRFFFRKRAKETEEKVAQERVELSNAVIDERGEKAREQAEANIETANRNQQVRQENTRKVIRSQEFYNDVVRDPDSVDRDFALSEAARTGALKSHDPNKVGGDVNPNSDKQRITQYKREQEQFDQTGDLQEVKNVGGTVASTAITVEEKYTARQQKQDRINKVLTIIGTTAARLGIEFVRTGFNTEQVTQVKNPDKVVKSRGKARHVQKAVYKDVTTTKLDGSKKLSDLEYDDDALSNVWLDPNGDGVVHTQYARGDDPIRAFTIRATGADGKIKEVSIAQAGYGMKVDQHVYDVIDQDLSNLSIIDALELLRSRMPRLFDEYLDAVGLRGAPMDKIAQNAIENGNFFGQTAKMAGWERISPSNLTTTTQRVVDHMKDITIPGKVTTRVIPGQVRDVTTTVFNPQNVVNTAIQGAAAGAAMGLSDQLHEAAKQTKRVDPGTFEERTPSLPISKLAKRAQDKLNRKKASATKGNPNGPDIEEDEEQEER